MPGEVQSSDIILKTWQAKEICAGSASSFRRIPRTALKSEDVTDEDLFIKLSRKKNRPLLKKQVSRFDEDKFTKCTAAGNEQNEQGRRFHKLRSSSRGVAKRKKRLIARCGMMNRK